ncbi:two-component system, response regulator YesN [Gracilibacillus ureilyticus]|uniref:Two-component system, response regulator YesN n=1 Tax=Gracilibacillus ureilyticus TaxID=531814 RepID=A0A1H9R4J9_9BACI|nr:response regulator [Gracilibacillus ureilyticus]SER67771.1 two-component system, response regulator YesN [Gracilibacillus ureilyticus]
MIKVLLVEDDKLVRKSLIAAFDWKSFGMEVVGEAKNGEKAREFLQENHVDLLITDLAMPIMSGIELIRIVKERYPDIFIVVLSLHRDFEYIQEAMRLGAIDYIAKVELDSENMDKTLARIKKRIDAEIRKNPRSFNKDTIFNGWIVLFEYMSAHNKQTLEEIIQEEEIIYTASDAVFVPLENDWRKKTYAGKISAIPSWEGAIIIINVDDSSSCTFQQLQQLIQRFKENIFFYELDQPKSINIRDIGQIPITVYHPETDNMKKVREELLSLQWVFEQNIFNKMLYGLKQLRLTKNKLMELLIITMSECRRIFAEILPDEITLPDSFHYWYEVEQWLAETKANISETIYKKTISNETTQCIIRAIYLIEKRLGETITATDISGQVNMSRSYFCVCFKQVAGFTFHEYVKLSRINKAKHFLENSLEKVSLIAEKVGYTDVKYFSKVFKQETGFLPSEYRKKHKRV